YLFLDNNPIPLRNNIPYTHTHARKQINRVLFSILHIKQEHKKNKKKHIISSIRNNKDFYGVFLLEIKST
ncbi:hypothetical protein NQU37_26280, partial [Escherichia coli]|uniref:hypothetical protein n=1 Tax=Escherichia coli TaxID=562 RepID=UPI002118045F